MCPQFLYFDLGKVLVDFSVEQMLQKMAEVSDTTPERVREALIAGGLQADFETGRITTRQFYEGFYRQIGTRPAASALLRAGTESFCLNLSLLPVVAHLQEAGCHLGILSNTCESHWEYCFQNYRIVAESFQAYALSYRIGVTKPNPRIYRAAAEIAGCKPQDIFFTDDISGHVDAARQAGFDAVVYTSTPQLVAELRRRGVRFSY
jgi:FMN phosphatase YigB (HAD superfamily)